MKKGFTLIEILIIVGVFLIILVSTSEIMLGIFNSQNRNDAMDKIDQNGSWISNELKKNILNASGKTENGVDFICPMDSEGGDFVTITNVKDGEKTTISCIYNTTTKNYKIASISGTAVGTTVYLFQNNDNLILSDCSHFVNCTTLPSLQLSEVKFNFSLGTNTTFGLLNGLVKPFVLNVTLRN